MSDSPLYDLQITYPLLWDTRERTDAEQQAWDELRVRIKDIRVQVVLPSSLVLSDDISFSLLLTGVDGTNNTATVVLSLLGVSSYYQQFSIPVYTENTLAPTGSYAAMSEIVTWSGVADIHPSCLMLLQEPPKIKAYINTAYYSDNTRTDVLSDLSALNFSVGHNVSLSHGSEDTQTTLTFMCGAGNGSGIWTISPWDDIENLDSYKITGLRSINGITDNVSIIGDTSVRVTTIPPISGSTVLNIQLSTPDEYNTGEN